MNTPKPKTVGKSKAASKPQRGKQAEEKKPPIDYWKQWLRPIFTFEDPNGQYHVSTAPVAFDLELLGTVAARLLTGTDYIQAAHRAHLLLLACKAFNYHVTSESESLAKHVTRLNESDLPQIVPFDRAARVVTGQRRTDRGLPLFRKLFEALYTYPSVSDQNDHMEEMKERGFTKAYVLHLKRTFESLRNTGQLGIRQPPKKDLPEETDAKSDTNTLPPCQEG